MIRTTNQLNEEPCTAVLFMFIGWIADHYECQKISIASPAAYELQTKLSPWSALPTAIYKSKTALKTEVIFVGVSTRLLQSVSFAGTNILIHDFSCVKVLVTFFPY